MVKSTKSCFNSWISIKPDRTITRLFHIHRLFKWSFSVANYKLLWKRQSKATFWFNRALSFSSLHITQRVTVIAGVRTAIFIVFCCFLRNQTGHFWQGQKFCHVLQLFFRVWPNDRIFAVSTVRSTSKTFNWPQNLIFLLQCDDLREKREKLWQRKSYVS